MTLKNKFTVLPTLAFKNELKNIIYYITNILNEPNTARNLYLKVSKQIHSLQYLPERYPKFLNSQNKNIRRFFIKNYIIVYEVLNDTRSNIYSTHISLKSKLFKSIIIILNF